MVEVCKRNLLVAIDRGEGSRITLYSIVVSSISAVDILARYEDRFKHVKLLSRLERTTCFPKALRVIRTLVDIGVLLGVDVTNYLDVLLDRVERVSDKIHIAVIDDCLVNIIRDKIE